MGYFESEPQVAKEIISRMMNSVLDFKNCNDTN